jgi:hypothetical protein
MKNSRSEPQQSMKSGAVSPGSSVEKQQRKSLSMHDGIAVWCDCCSCEMEPYWAAVAEEMGIDVYNDYEE